MSSVKNLRINERAIKKGKRFSLKKVGFAIFLASVIAVTGLVGYAHVNDLREQNQIETIVSYYGEDSQESLILDYIEIADKLDSLSLENYKADSKLYDKHECKTEIMSPDELEDMIVKFKQIVANGCYNK